MALPTLLELAQSGAHFGHRRSLTSPKAKQFIYSIRNNVALIDLEKTQDLLEEAKQVLNEYRTAGQRVLLAGTKRSIRNITSELGQKSDIPYLSERWLGGFLTNFSNFQTDIKRMNELEAYLDSPEAAEITKKKRLMKSSKLNRYHRFLGGVKKLTGLPELLILGSASEDGIAIKEANRLGIPIIAITDTDINPELITYPIPANDDAPKAVRLILEALLDTTPTPKAKAVKETVETDEKPKAEKKKAVRKTADKTVKAKPTKAKTKA